MKIILKEESSNPLYINSIGIDLDEVVDKFVEMDGKYRIPKLLNRVDQESRKIAL